MIMSELRAGHVVALCVFVLLTLGIIMVISAGLTIDSESSLSIESILTSRTFMYALLACVMLGLGSIVNVDWFTKSFNGIWSAFQVPIWLFLISVTLLCMVYVNGIGRVVNSSRRWITVGPGSWHLSFQPSELAKWSILIVLAWFICRIGYDRLRKFWTGFVPALGLVLIICGLIVKEDLGTAVLIGAVGLTVILAAGARWWHLLLVSPIPIIGIYKFIVTSDYRMDRIRAFLNPYEDPGGAGYHIIQSLSAIADGKFTGRGLGHGIHKFGYLPEDTTDFLFAIICEELGVGGAILVMALYVALFFAGFAIIKKLKNRFARLLALGIVLTVSYQALMNLMVVTGLAPTKGIALPLLSSGGTGWLLTAFSLGLLISIDRRQGIQCDYINNINNIEDELTPLQDTDTDTNIDADVEALPAVISIAAS